MKTVKIFLLVLAVLMGFISCEDSNAIDSENNSQKSAALRTVLNELKLTNNIAGRSAARDSISNSFCFEFIYPVTLTYSNNTEITIATFTGLIDVLTSETPNLYLSGIVFPFQVIENTLQNVTNTNTIIINNEAEFLTLIQNCNFNTLNDDLLQPLCFDFVFPIGFSANNATANTFAVNDLQELHNYLRLQLTNSSGYLQQMVFPISVISNNQTVVVNNLYELYQMINSCDNPCICTQEYAPVCVQVRTDSIATYPNLCYAICDGYTQNDIVSCNPAPCEISNLVSTVGSCNPSGTTFQLTINFTTSLPGATQFDVHNQMGVLVGTYNLSELPLTLDYVTSTAGSDGLSVNLVGVKNCTLSTTWFPPNCGCVCPTNFAPVCVQTANGIVVQYGNSCLAECAGYTANNFVNCNPSTSNFSTQLGTCFQIAFPVTVLYNGQTAIVNSNGELLQYWNGTDAIPNLVYPITVTFINPAATFVFASQADFQTQISSHCN
jgi:hypothetical protein